LAAACRFEAKAKEVKRLFATPGPSGRLSSQQEQERIDAIAELRRANAALYDELLELETMQVDQFINAIDTFEANYTGMHSATLEAITSTFQATRELAAFWIAEAHEVTHERHEWFVAENLNDSDDISDELKAVLNDKDGLVASLDAANEARIGFLDSTEDQLGKAEKAEFTKVITELREGEHRRNRERVNEVSSQVHTINKELIDKLDRSMDADEN
jgi:hypothetical protein